MSGRVQMFYFTPLQDIHLNTRKFWDRLRFTL